MVKTFYNFDIFKAYHILSCLIIRIETKPHHKCCVGRNLDTNEIYRDAAALHNVSCHLRMLFQKNNLLWSLNLGYTFLCKSILNIQTSVEKCCLLPGKSRCPNWCPKMGNSIIYTLSCCFKPISLYFTEHKKRDLTKCSSCSFLLIANGDLGIISFKNDKKHKVPQM